MAISQPSNTTFTSGSTTGKLVWSTSFATKRTSHFDKIQKYVDSEVLRLCSPLVPFDTGNLEKSGKLGTVVGSGEVKYIAPYAAYQYYNTSESRSYDGNRGGNWFERMKASSLDDIKAGAEKISM